MASHNVVRKLLSAVSCMPLRRTHLLRPSTGNCMTVARNETRGRYMNYCAEQLNNSPTTADENNNSTSQDRQIQVGKQGDGALARDRNSPLQIVDVMDSFFPTRSLRSMIDTMDRIFDDPFLAPSRILDTPLRRALRTPWDFKETDDAFKLRLDMPGLAKDDVQVYVEEDCLVVKGERNVENNPDQRSHGSYFTRISLPDNVNPEQIKAELKHGVLNVTVPKVQDGERKKTVIDVQVE